MSEKELNLENFSNIHEALKILERFEAELKDAKQKLLDFLKGNEMYFGDYCVCERGSKNKEARKYLEGSDTNGVEFLFEKSCNEEMGELGIFLYDEKLSKFVFNSANFRVTLAIAEDATKQVFEDLNFGIFEAALLKLSHLVREYNDSFRNEKELNFENIPGLERIEQEINETLVQLKTLDEIQCVLEKS